MLSTTSAIQTMPTCSVRTARPAASRPRTLQVIAGAQQPNKTLQGLAGGLAAVTLLLGNPGSGLAATDLQSLKGVGATEIPGESNEFPARPFVPAPPYTPDNNAQDQAPAAPKKAKGFLGLFSGNNNKATKQVDTLQNRAENAIDNNKGPLKRAANSAVDNTKQAANSLKQGSGNSVTGAAADAAASVKGAALDTANKAKSAVQGTGLDRAAGKAEGAKNSVINAVQGAGSDAADKVGDAKDSLLQNTKNLFSGNAGGANEQASSTADAVKQGARDLKDGTFNAIDRAGDKLMEGPKRVGQEVNRQVQKKNIQAVPASAAAKTQEIAREQGILGENYQGPAVSKEEAMDRGEKYLR